MTTLVHTLDELTEHNAVAVGGAKIGRLVEMQRAGVHVPRGFVLGVEAYRAHWPSRG